ncbi:MAG: polymorphic toxin type 50 domain-containing protein [Clostridia bacterium]|nr:polymorphic toxin type 50 domain-containing protein [Clostridia bacterium]
MIRKHQFWYTLKGELDHESKNLIKEATGHKVDNLVELSEIGMSIYAGKVASKKITGKLGEESEKLSGLLKKTRKPTSVVTRAKRLVKKFMPKKRYRKFKVVDIEELAERQCLKPNIQLFADDIGEPIYKLIHGEKKNIRLHLGHHKKHFLDVNNKNYIEGKSILYISAEEAQGLLDEFAGKGEMAPKCTHKEIVDFGKVIGESIDEVTGIGTPTTWGKIHYGKKGAHIVPYLPDDVPKQS